jgi:ferric-dicitrate binding protein FerR (iron transport regulator)
LSQSNFDRLLQKYLSGECTEEEEKIVLEWYETLIKKSDLHLSEAEKSRIEAKLWNTIKTNVREEEPAPAKVIPLTARTWFRIAVAACLIAVTGTGIMLYRYNATINQQTALAQVKAGFDSLVNETTAEKKLVLADSSVIALQPGAVVYYPPAFTGTAREVYLQGSAFFKVYHNPLKHFKVHLGSGLTTEVLGTSFNIIQNKSADNIEVAVVTGKVRVYRQQTQQGNATTDSTGDIILTRNKKVTWSATSSRFITGIVDNPQPLQKTKMQNGAHNGAAAEQLAFEETPLHAVLQSLSNVYGINITCENEQLAMRHFTGDLSHYNLFTQLDIICKSAQTTYEVNGTDIIIKDNQNR